ncbi:STAS domain-containing protein [Streptomyces sp. NPDC005574]|uniref:STAS domain-containing protein n=1 Tax=Streptomyces sp. NPDC005574 TaxID=3156891 RepID=UPI0033B1D757
MAVEADDLLQTCTLWSKDTVLLRVIGELDVATAPLLDQAVTAALVGCPRDFRLDLTALVFCDAAGLRALRRLTDTVHVAYVSFRLVGLHPNVHRTLARLGTMSPWSPPLLLH